MRTSYTSGVGCSSEMTTPRPLVAARALSDRTMSNVTAESRPVEILRGRERW
jgi:hypothetical protein